MSNEVQQSIRRRQARRRERIATAVLAGMYANPVNERMVNEAGPYTMARWAVEAADALMDHLTAAGAREELHAYEQSRTAESEVTA